MRLDLADANYLAVFFGHDKARPMKAHGIELGLADDTTDDSLVGGGCRANEYL